MLHHKFENQFFFTICFAIFLDVSEWTGDRHENAISLGEFVENYSMMFGHQVTVDSSQNLTEPELATDILKFVATDGKEV